MAQAGECGAGRVQRRMQRATRRAAGAQQPAGVARRDSQNACAMRLKVRGPARMGGVLAPDSGAGGGGVGGIERGLAHEAGEVERAGEGIG